MFVCLRREYSSAKVGSIHGHSWKRQIQKALRENDPEKLVHFVYATENALFFRWQELDAKFDKQERAAMRSAADNLLAIKVHKLGWPGIQR
jgi:hypothetical protein